MGDLGRFLGQGFVVEFRRLVRVETEVELVVPAEFEAGLTEGVVVNLRAGVAFGQVGGVGGELVGDDANLDVILVRHTEHVERCFVAIFQLEFHTLLDHVHGHMAEAGGHQHI